MAVPKRKTSPSARGMRRAHLALKKKSSISEDKTTGELHRSHHVAKNGHYNGRLVTKSKVNV